jgi:hypothetical protein
MTRFIDVINQVEFEFLVKLFTTGIRNGLEKNLREARTQMGERAESPRQL